MKVENYPDWKETSLGLPPFSTEPWLWEDDGRWVHKTLDMDDTSRGPLPVESGVLTPSNYRENSPRLPIYKAICRGYNPTYNLYNL